MENGTYLVLDAKTTTLAKIETRRGYWVAESETQLSGIRNGDLIGIWTDTETGKTWVDNTHYFTELDTALEFAKRHNQLAIWDNLANREVRV
jgi:hypothetical protein